MKAFSKFLLLPALLLTLINGSTFAQIPSTDDLTSSAKARKWQDRAMEAYSFNDPEKAESFCLKALRADPGYVLPYMMLGDIYSSREEYDESIAVYQALLAIKPGIYPDPYYFLARAQYMVNDYEASIPNFKQFLDFEDIDPFRAMNAEDMLASAIFRSSSMASPVPFNPENIGQGVNTPFDEYVNVISTDGRHLLFTRKIPIHIEKELYEEDVYISTYLDGAWQVAKTFNEQLSATGSIGAISLSPDGMYFFFTACHIPQGFGSCDLYYMRRNGDHWTPPENLGPVVNTSAWESQPSFSADGKTLYFASRRPGGFGSSDIWKSEIMADGKWDSPVNLGERINTVQAEMSPQIHHDGQTLYFSSKGHLGMGGYDLFYARLDSAGQWAEPVNLGYPVNSLADEVNIIVTSGGEEAYISSDQLGGYGKFDVYRFELPTDARPVKVTYMKGRVYDEQTGKPLMARFELIDLDNGRTAVESWSDEVSGEFLVCLPSNHHYALNVSSEWYLFHSENFNLMGGHSALEPYLKDIPLRKIEKGKSVVLENIFYETDKYELLPESKVELQKLIAYLNQYPSLKIEIGGHTDNTGTAEYNADLSDKRASSVYQYLLAEGISGSRLLVKGYGFNMPVASNDTEDGRAKNRRTEFKVLDF